MIEREAPMDDERTLQALRDIAAGFDSHDVARILRHFAPDAVFESPRGPDRWGQRFVGLDAIRGAFAGRFETIPDVRYRDDTHFAAGDRGASEWKLTGTTTDGVNLDLRGCDLWTLRDGLVVKKDSYWKMRTG
jgi:ketosteroid isomerase-like protein